ncbi:MAG: glycosyltransferase [Oscillospiraceae bacterium]|nr:glycosyltransferase [Oscillospiraceae bacterium]
MKIDVIVPIYKVERYLRRCVDSLLAQTFRDFTVILVDDGSPDGCPAICDEYAAKHENIIAVHKENGGLSDARNYGMKFSKAELITFIDSDDYVNEDYLKHLYDVYAATKADVVISSFKRVYLDQDDNELRTTVAPFKKGTLSRDSALCQLCYEYQYSSFAWAKLYKRELVLKNPYPVGKYFEDSFTTYKILAASKKVACTGCSDYYYIQREGSIQHHAFEPKHYDLVIAAGEMMQFFEKGDYPQSVITAAAYKLCKSCHITLRHAAESEQFLMYYKKCRALFAPYLKYVLRDHNVKRKDKLIFTAMRLSGTVYREVFKRLS